MVQFYWYQSDDWRQKMSFFTQNFSMLTRAFISNRTTMRFEPFSGNFSNYFWRRIAMTNDDNNWNALLLNNVVILSTFLSSGILIRSQNVLNYDSFHFNRAFFEYNDRLSKICEIFYGNVRFRNSLWIFHLSKSTSDVNYASAPIASRH